MLVNRDKTTAQFFALSTKPHSPSLFYDSERIQITQSTRYLRIEVDSKLRWVDHIESAVNKTSKTEMIKRLTEATWGGGGGAPQDVLVTTYKSYVRPVLKYGSEAYHTASDNTKNKLNIVQNSALKLICGAAKSTPTTALESQSDIKPPSRHGNDEIFREIN
ncbi:uncharacterized protein CDAR_413831 [Caerostris darwini]|uniref:Uncharacterized protein n=1 Tax=Caerostris darwini TaxID=1538125 RepID=A0AAV4UE55_9ARAC|nr:uncharacterized protein CDAR_413831 [Caerostris darwini]